MTSSVRASQMAQPALALSLLQELGLAPAVYAPPEHIVPPPPEGGYDWACGAAVARAAARMLASRACLPAMKDETVDPGGDEATSGASLGTSGTVACARAATTTVGNGGQALEKGNGQEAGVTTMVVGVDGATACVATAADDTTTNEGTPVEGKRKAKATPDEKGVVEKGGEEGSDGGKQGNDPTTLVRELFLCAAMLPLAGVQHKVKKKLVSAAQSVVQESLKVH